MKIYRTSNFNTNRESVYLFIITVFISGGEDATLIVYLHRSLFLKNENCLKEEI